MALTITQMLVSPSMYDIKSPYYMEPIGTTTHETGNKASAMSEISYMLGNRFQISYHFAVDDLRVVQGLPLNRNGWHSGDGGEGRGNRKTIGVEICYNWNGVTTTKNDARLDPLYKKAVANSVELQAQLFIQFPQWGVPTAGVNMWRHYDHSRKNCPQRMIEEGYWNIYVSLVRARYLELKGGKTATSKPASKPVSKPVGKTLVVGKQAKQWLTGEGIPSFVIGGTYDILDEKSVNKSQSKKVYLIGKGKVATGWLLEQDIEGFKPAAVSKKTIKVGKQANKWATGEGIPSFVIGGTYDILEEKAVNKSYSKKMYLIGKGKVATGWLLEQDVEGFKRPVTAAAPTPVPKNKPVGKTLKVGKQATQWLTGERIPSFVIGGTYDVLERKAVKVSLSKTAYLIGKGKTATGWLLEQDVDGFKR